ncbi:hemolysin family protein [Lapidilactobacillus gannanensis]|uniref:Hemolysin family protein n=1 Tax=Lapidilactobacillus gannanensis TaxID=2486002 RepID=A0ABW4BPB4_9LACO|nr:hemolysin family protein [Lapidilactobacillus gannanensis]
MSGDPASSSLGGQILLIVILTFVNAFFAAAEMAIVSVNRNKIEAEASDGDKRAKSLLQVMNDSSSFLATIQVAITFAGFLSSASAATSMAKLLAPVFGTASWAEQASVIIITIILSYISLVFGELFPKQIALAKAEQVAKLSVGPVKFVRGFLRPFVWLLSASTNLLVKVTPVDLSTADNQVTRDDMLSVIEKSRKTGVINPDEYNMLEGIINFNDIMAREVMVPRTDAFMVDINDPDSDNIDRILAQPYSRVPVYQEDKDVIVGILHIKNILQKAHSTGFDHLKLADIMTAPMFVPETVNINELLLEMQKTHQQMAILLDEYGGVVGLATIEDLIEEIVGEIDDESDATETLFTKVNDHRYVIAGKMPLSDFNDQFGTNLENDDVDTIAGFVITELGTIPTNGNHLQVTLANGMVLTTGVVRGSRLENVTLEIPAEPVVIPEEPEDN